MKVSSSRKHAGWVGKVFRLHSKNSLSIGLAKSYSKNRAHSIFSLWIIFVAFTIYHDLKEFLLYGNCGERKPWSLSPMPLVIYLNASPSNAPFLPPIYCSVAFGLSYPSQIRTCDNCYTYIIIQHFNCAWHSIFQSRQPLAGPGQARQEGNRENMWITSRLAGQEASGEGLGGPRRNSIPGWQAI